MWEMVTEKSFGKMLAGVSLNIIRKHWIDTGHNEPWEGPFTPHPFCSIL
jgi:hypothetical protein